MELKRINGQPQKDLRQFYDLSHWSLEHWHKPIASMRELVMYLEEAVDFPPQWVYTSHENLVFARQDDSRQSLVSVHPLGERHGGPAKAKFEMNQWVEPPWSHAVGYAETVEQVWQMIMSVLPEHPTQASV